MQISTILEDELKGLLIFSITPIRSNQQGVRINGRFHQEAPACFNCFALRLDHCL